MAVVLLLVSVEVGAVLEVVAAAVLLVAMMAEVVGVVLRTISAEVGAEAQMQLSIRVSEVYGEAVGVVHRTVEVVAGAREVREMVGAAQMM